MYIFMRQYLHIKTLVCWSSISKENAQETYNKNFLNSDEMLGKAYMGSTIFGKTYCNDTDQKTKKLY